MNCRIAALLLGLTATAAFAKEQVLLTEDDTWKLYTTPELAVTDINGNTATLGGIGIGAILNDHLWFGGAARILVNDIKADEAGSVQMDQYDFWYAGLTVGYTFMPESLVHFSVGALVGGGQAQLDTSADNSAETEAFVIIEPGVNLMINVSETVEFGVGVSYRHCAGADIDALTDEDLSDITGTVFFRVTEF
jgi:hypothetical protein